VGYRKFVARGKEPANPFIDPEGYRAYVDHAEAEFRQGVVHQSGLQHFPLRCSAGPFAADRSGPPVILNTSSGGQEGSRLCRDATRAGNLSRYKRFGGRRVAVIGGLLRRPPRRTVLRPGSLLTFCALVESSPAVLRTIEKRYKCLH
jgi:hypothetical protein